MTAGPGEAAARSARAAWIVFALLLLLTAAVYSPSLRGGYFFDDSIYFVDNPDVHVDTLDSGAWWRAATTQCGINLLCRPLSSITFAANYYFSGLDPYWPKLTNLAIHLLNGLALFALLRALLRLWAAVRGRDGAFDLGAAAIAGAWLLLPINFTGVAYVSQRMEALANLFVFLGLFWYLRERHRVWLGGGREWRLWLALLISTVAGLTAKEDAALLPLYTGVCEFAFTGFRNRDRRWSRGAVGAHVAFLLVPFVAGLLWIGPRAVHGFSSRREFTLLERLLTELRVLVDYIDWTLLPQLNALTFYHDDILPSHGLLDPASTALCGLALLALLGLALWQRARRPLFCLGILWFFAGHAMTATIVPLELVFEHRNYFPSLGLLLATVSLLAFEPVVPSRAPLRALALGAVLAFFSFTTYLRAQEWSHPLRLAYSEALKRPDSQRAQYSLAHTLILASKEPDSPLIAQSIEILQRDAASPRSGIASLQALIFLSARAQHPIDPSWWQAMERKLQQHTPSQTDVQAIIFLYHCQRRGECPKQVPELLAVFQAALAKSEDVDLMSAYGEFALLDLGDAPLAERMYRGAAEARPQVAVYRANLVRFLIATGQFAAADTALAELERLNRFGAQDVTVTELREQLRAARDAAQESR